MAIEVLALSELSADDVSDMAALLGAMLADRFSDLDPARGAIGRILLHPASVLSLKSRTELDRLRRALSLATAATDPELVDPDLLDAAASNFRIERYPGSAAGGSIIIVVSRLDPLLIPVGFEVQARGIAYRTDRAYSVRTSQSGVTSDDDRVLTPTADDQWSFAIPVTAQKIGAAGRLLRGEAVAPTALPANYIKAYAASDFVGGVDQETNTALLSRVRAGVACRAMSDRVSMSAALLAESPSIVTHSIIGAGDPEMRRDQHGIFPGSFGGCVDWYVRAALLPTRELIGKTATLVDTDDSGYGIWQFSLGRDEAPGFYDVYQVVPAGSTDSGGYTVVGDVRGFDLADVDDSQVVPDIVDAAEAAYSMFQTAAIRFTDPDTSVTGLTVGSSTKEYDVVVRKFPGIRDLQEIFGKRDRSVSGDVLVRAPVPAWLTVSLDIRTPAEALEIDEETVKNDVLSAINELPIGSELPGSVILDVVHRHLPTGAFVRSLDMLCRIRTPAGENVWFRGSELIEIPNRPAEQVTPRTTVFVLEPEQISLSISLLQRQNV